MSKVKVAKTIAELLESIKKEGHSELSSTMYYVLDQLDDNDLAINNITLIDLARAITDGYEVKQEPMKFRAVLQNVATGNKIRNIESVWVDDPHEANRIGEIGLEFYGGEYFTIEEVVSK